MTHSNALVLGNVGTSAPLVLSREARSTHLYLAGATGTGKSKALEGFVRQDVLAWSRSRCGLLLLDRHGSLCQSVTDWMASHDLRCRPVVPLDLRRDDWVVSYNPIRPRAADEADGAAVVSGFVRGIAHAWGASDLSATPLLAKWLRTVLSTLYEGRMTLGEALHLIRSPECRHRLAARVQDPVARSVWQMSGSLREAEFQEQLGSTVNRLVKFLSCQVVRASLCQTGLSLDLAAAIRSGSILLVNLSTEGSRIDAEDAATFGSVLLSDLWTAAKSRGKHERGPAEKVKPYYVFLDEFQEFVNPTMAEALDQARGFGLHFTLAHQTPRQLLNRGEVGRRVFDSVMANARTKLVFQLEHPEDLPLLAEWLYRNDVDPDAVKHQGYSTKVLGHSVEYLSSYSTVRTRGTSEATNWSDTDSRSDTAGKSWLDAQSNSVTGGTSEGHTRTRGLTRSRGRGSSEGDSDTASEQAATNWGRGTSVGTSWTEGEGETSGGGHSTSRSSTVARSLERPSRTLKEDLADADEDYHDLLDTAGEDGEEDEEKAKRLDQVTQRVGLSDTRGKGDTESTGRSLTRSRGGSESTSDQVGGSLTRGTAQARNRSRSTNQSVALSASTAYAIGRNHAITRGTTHTAGGNESVTYGTAHAQGGSRGRSSSLARGESSVPVVMPVLGREATTPVFRSVADQLFVASQKLAAQPQRHCTVKLVGTALPVQLVTRTLRPALVTVRWRERWLARVYAELPFALPMGEALERIAARERALGDGHAGPSTAKRRVR